MLNNSNDLLCDRQLKIISGGIITFAGLYVVCGFLGLLVGISCVINPPKRAKNKIICYQKQKRLGGGCITYHRRGFSSEELRYV